MRGDTGPGIAMSVLTSGTLTKTTDGIHKAAQYLRILLWLANLYEVYPNPNVSYFTRGFISGYSNSATNTKITNIWLSSKFIGWAKSHEINLPAQLLPTDKLEGRVESAVEVEIKGEEEKQALIQEAQPEPTRNVNRFIEPY
jgi:hypothetical protein